MKKIIWIAILIFSITACDMQDEAIEPPAKPESVPESAFWIGGHEGGVFISISRGQDSKTYFGTIYFDANGEIWYQGKFQYTGDASFNVGDKLSYTGWDGDFLFLANGEKLIAVNESK